MTSVLRSLVAAACLVAGAAQAQVSVQQAWARATVPQQPSSGVFLQIRSATPARLLQASSSMAETVQIHEMKMSGDVMKMQAVDALELPAGKTVELKPGGYHIMLMGLKQQLKPGDSVPLTLVVEGADGKRTDIKVSAAVRPLGATGEPAKH